MEGTGVFERGRRLGLLVVVAVVFQTVMSTAPAQAAGCTPTHFIVALNQSDQIDGSAVTNFKASAANNQNNVCTSWSGSVTFSSNDPAMQVAWNSTNPATTSTGVAFIKLVPRTPGSITVTATSGSLTGNATYPVGDTHITLSFPTTVQAGVPADMTITAVSEWTGLASTSFYGSPAIHTGETSAEWYETVPSGDPNLPRWDGADNADGDLVTEIWHQIPSYGTITYKTIFYDPGPRSIFAYDATRPANKSGFQVLSVLASTLVISAPASVDAGQAASVQVEARNAADQRLTNFEGSVRLTSSDPAAVISTPNPFRFTPADGGTHNYALTLNTVGQQTVTAAGTTDPSFSDTASLTVGTLEPPPSSDFRFNVLFGLGDASLKTSGVFSGLEKYKAVDGDTVTRWSPPDFQGPPAGHYWAADLGATQSIIGYRLVQLYEQDVSASVDIYGSNDPSAWSWLPSGKISGAPTANGWTLVASLSGLTYPSDTGIVSLPDAVSYRYWLFHATDTTGGGSSEFDINEVELWAPFLEEPAPDGTEEEENGGTGGDPVQTFSGAYRYRHTDLAIAGRGPAIDFVRAYSSADTRSGPLGPGWTHSYNVRLRGTGDGSQDLLLVRADGNTDRFTHQPDGSFSPPDAVYSTLVENPNGSYLVTDKDQSAWSFDHGGRLTAVSDRYGNTSTLTYNSQGRLGTISEPASRGHLSLTYGSTGRLVTVSDWLGTPRTVTYGYDTSGRLQTVTDRRGKITTFAYDGASSHLATITDANGHVALTLAYDGQGRVSTQKDARGITTGDETTFGYVVNGDGTRTTTVTHPTTSLEPSFHRTVVDSYAATGWLTSRVSQPSSTETLTETYAYDTIGDRAAVTDARGNVTNFCYDVDYAGAAIGGSRGNLTRVIGPAPTTGADRPVTLTDYDAQNNIVQTVTPKGVLSGTSVPCTTDLSAIDTDYATDYGYDTSGAELLSVTTRFTDPDAGSQTAITKLEYGDAANPGRVTKIIPPRGNTGGTPDYSYATTLTYFGTGTQRGMLSRVTDALGNATTYQYDPVGRLISSVDALGNASGGVAADHTTTYTYDKEDQVRFVSLPAPIAGGAQLVSETRFDDVGNPTVRIDAKGQVTTYAYDERDALFQVKESPNAWTDPANPPSGVTTAEYAYDAGGYLTRMTRAKGDAQDERVTDYVHDGRGLLRRETQYPAWPATSPTLVTTTTFDPNGSPLTLLDPLGQTTTNGYDDLNRLTSIDYSASGTPDVTYGYDANGNRTAMTDGNGTASYAYDEANRLTSVTTPGPKTVGYRYDLDGNRVKLVYPDATAVTYTFNKADQLSSLEDWASRQVSYSYFPDGLVQTVTQPDSSVATYAYDNARRTTGIVDKHNATLNTQLAYTLDPAGNVTDVVEWVRGVSQGSPSWLDRTVVNDVTTSHQVAPALVIGADGAAHAVWQDQGGAARTIRYARRDAATGAWAASEQVGETTGANQDAPAIAVDAANNVYVVWTDDRNGSSDADIYFSKRSAATGAWSTSVRVNDDGTGARQDSPALALSSSGAAVAIWFDARGGGSKQNIYSARLPAGASAWAANIKVTSNTSANKEGPRVAIGSDGTAYAVWGDARNSGQYDVYFASLASGSSTWSTNSKVSDDPGSAAQLQPDIGVDGAGNLTAVWRDERVTPAAVRSARRPAGGPWAASVSIGGSDAADPHLAVRSDGRGEVAWQTGWPGIISAAEYNAGNGIWSSPETVSAKGETGQHPALAIDGGQLIALWDSGPLGNPDIYARLKPLAGYGGPDTFAAGYDRLDRLTSVDGPDGNRSYTYDPVGNRLSKVLGGTTNYSYDHADRITAAGATSMTVNANGNLSAKGADTFGYDQANRVTSATVGGASETYAYDGDGVRFSRQLGANPAIRYVTDPNRSLPVTLDDGTRKYVWGLGLAYAVNGSTLEVYHADRLGSVRALTDASGAATDGYRFDEYGLPTVTTGSSSQPFAFTGEPRDATGLSYLRARYYDPSLGRFVTRDMLAGSAFVPASLNRFTYVQNGPLTWVDPTGRSSSSKATGENDDCADVGVGGRILRVGLGSFLFVAGAGIVVLGAAVVAAPVAAEASAGPEAWWLIPETIEGFGYGGLIIAGGGLTTAGGGVVVALSC
jgi:RHS repeat-associated protein